MIRFWARLFHCTKDYSSTSLWLITIWWIAIILKALSHAWYLSFFPWLNFSAHNIRICFLEVCTCEGPHWGIISISILSTLPWHIIFFRFYHHISINYKIRCRKNQFRIQMQMSKIKISHLPPVPHLLFGAHSTFLCKEKAHISSAELRWSWSKFFSGRILEAVAGVRRQQAKQGRATGGCLGSNHSYWPPPILIPYILIFILSSGDIFIWWSS